MNERRGVGMRGEELAARHLAAAGLEIVARNVRLPAGEIDIVARDGGEVVVVEVKTRVGDDETTPDEAVTPAKLSRLDRLAQQYADSVGQPEQPWRVDVVAIVLARSGQIVRLAHVRGAYL
ncbi:MAG: YraN family protein [Chloroflexi bacterium]|nr:YraN family protein [Chloroflexota bacterium]